MSLAQDLQALRARDLAVNAALKALRRAEDWNPDSPEDGALAGLRALQACSPEAKRDAAPLFRRLWASLPPNKRQALARQAWWEGEVVPALRAAGLKANLPVSGFYLEDEPSRSCRGRLFLEFRPWGRQKPTPLELFCLPDGAGWRFSTPPPARIDDELEVWRRAGLLRILTPPEPYPPTFQGLRQALTHLWGHILPWWHSPHRLPPNPALIPDLLEHAFPGLWWDLPHADRARFLEDGDVRRLVRCALQVWLRPTPSMGEYAQGVRMLESLFGYGPFDGPPPLKPPRPSWAL